MLNEFKKLMSTLRIDWVKNKRNPKSKFAITGFRIASFLRGDKETPRLVSVPVIILYKLIIEWFLGIEIPAKTQIGPGLVIFHGFGLVINGDAKIGSNVTLRNGVTIGHAREGGKSPQIGSDVNIGAGALIIGDITIGNHVFIGAGAVVVKSVESNCTVVGNPAHLI
jgi:serine O-acetyltransferase/putative colanic acid biosynthesis acetyltransferase WcaB